VPRRPTLPSLRLRAAATLLAVCAGAPAAPLGGPARAAIDSFLQAQLAGAPGEVTLRVDAPAGGALPPCATPQAFLPAGVVPWGSFTVGVRCAGERPWTRYLRARTIVQGRYLAAARAIAPGQALHAADAVERSGDLAALPRTVLTDVARLEGRVATSAVAPGAPLRLDFLRGTAVVRRGQQVRLVAEGASFVASTEARALADAQAGELLQVRTAAGRVLSGVARADGLVGLRR